MGLQVLCKQPGCAEISSSARYHLYRLLFYVYTLYDLYYNSHMAVIIEAGPSSPRAAAPSLSKDTSSSASTLLRTLKSNQLPHFDRIQAARQALSDAKIPRAPELVRQLILDEWLTPHKGYVDHGCIANRAELRSPALCKSNIMIYLR
jgi:hypothetical protein